MIIEEILKKYLSGELLNNDEEKLFKAYLRENGINPENQEEVEKFLAKEKLDTEKENFATKVPNEKEREALLQAYEKHLKELGDDKEALKKTIEENQMFSKQSVVDLIIAKASFLKKNIEEGIQTDKIVNKIEEVLKSETKETEAIDKKDIKEIVNSGLKEVTKDPSLALSETKIIPEIVKKANILEEDKPELTKKLNEIVEKEEDNDFILKRKEALLEKAHGKVSEKESEEIINKIIESKNPEKTIKELNNDLQKKLPKDLTTEITSEILIPVATKIEVEKKILKSQEVIDKITNENTKIITDSIEEILENKDDKLNPVDRENIEKIVKEGLEKVNNDTSQSLLETGVVPKLIGKFNVPDSKKEEVEVAVRQGSLKVEKQKNGKLGENINEVSKHKEWMRVYETILKKGTANEAKKGSDLISETSLSVKDIQSMGNNLENNGFSRNNETAKNEAKILGGLLLSKKKLPESLETINTISKRLGRGENGSLGKKITKLTQFQKYFGENSTTIRSIERIQQLINRRNLVYKVVGWGTKKTGLGLTEKYEDRMVDNMSTHFAKHGLKGGIESITKQLIFKRTVTSIVSDSSSEWVNTDKEEFFSSSTQEFVDKVFKVVSVVANAIVRIVLKIVKYVTALVVRLLKKLLVFVLKNVWKLLRFAFSALWKLLAPLLSSLIAATPAWVPVAIVVAVVGGVAIYNHDTIIKWSSALMVDVGSRGGEFTPNQPVDGEGNFIPGAPGLPGMIVPGECSVADKVVLTKQCDPAWGSISLTGPKMCDDGQGGTICRAGCGPTCVSMILRHQNQSYTPNTVIFGPLNGSDYSPYSDMDCDGSSFFQAKSALNIMGISNKYQGVCDQKAIGEWICAGKIVMVLSNFYYNDAGDTMGHFVLAVAVQDGNIITADPYYSVNTPFNGGGKGHVAPNRDLTCLTIDADTVK